MVTPYDWQEATRHRTQFVESRLSKGIPVLAASLDEGILMLTMTRRAHKIFEIYDKLMYGAIGQESDLESLRIMAIEFAHKEGYARSDDDVTIKRVVSAMSTPLKRAFADFNAPPFIVKALFAEVHPDPENDSYYILNYDGDFRVASNIAYLAGSPEAEDAIHNVLASVKSTSKMNAQEAVEVLKPAFFAGLNPDGQQDIKKITEKLSPQVMLFQRSGETVKPLKEVLVKSF